MDNEPTLTIDEYDTKEWWLKGKRHRVDGPAIEHTNGAKAWWLNGKRHRVDGPAIERHNGTKEWWLNGYHHEFDDWLKANSLISEEEKLMMKLTYG